MVPFHVPSLTKPQKQYNFLVNNSNHPFPHAWLPMTHDGSGSRSRRVHPAESFSPSIFALADKVVDNPTEPPPIELTPFSLVDNVDDLRFLAAKLHQANEFAVDLEHNHYRSFQGLTCLMQISTRTEDFLVDTLKLRAHIGPYLREVFKDPTKRKVMHGADNDMLWLQRDFGIYVCNLFDTMQASRVMNLERNSLAFLLKYFCGVVANKEYQCSDWRLRPLPHDMVKYAKEDTHYLLYIHDLMRNKLVDDSLGEVYKRSYEVCLKLYEKQLFDKQTSYLYIHGLREADFDANEIAIVAGLFEWRDNIARDEDESTGYVLPNKMLLEIARKRPLNERQLMQLLIGFDKPFALRDADLILEIIWESICIYASKFETVAEDLKKRVPISEIVARIRGLESSSFDEEKEGCGFEEIEGLRRMPYLMYYDPNLSAAVETKEWIIAFC